MRENREEIKRKEKADKEERNLREILTFHQILNQNIKYYINLRNSFEKDVTHHPAGIDQGAVVHRKTGSEIVSAEIKNFFEYNKWGNSKWQEIQIPKDLQRLLDATGSICEWLCDKVTMIPPTEFKFFSRMITNILSMEEMILIDYFIKIPD
ncbi:hypothetical protein, partial [Leptospira wolffii]